jgi:hypothetical protein
MYLSAVHLLERTKQTPIIILLLLQYFSPCPKPYPVSERYVTELAAYKQVTMTRVWKAVYVR